MPLSFQCPKEVACLEVVNEAAELSTESAFTFSSKALTLRSGETLTYTKARPGAAWAPDVEEPKVVVN